MGWRNSKDRQVARDRKANRYSVLGREFEKEFAEFLLTMKEEGLIDGFEAHEPNSPKDRSGCDFTVVKTAGCELRTADFGITRSLQVWNKRNNHKIAQFCFPFGSKPETMRRRVLELFLSEPSTSL